MQLKKIQMNLLFPLLYLSIVLIFLIIILRLVLVQIFSIQILQKQLNTIKIAINLNQASIETYLNLGEICLKKQLYSNAIEIYRKCLLRWDKNDKIGLAHLYTAVSFAYSKLAIFDFAQIYLEQAISNAPNCLAALKNATYIYKKRRLFKKSIETSIYLNELTTPSAKET